MPEHYRLLLAVGFCGGFTTYSSFVLELTAMIHRNEASMAFAYFMATTIGGFACFYLGLAVTRGLVLLLFEDSHDRFQPLAVFRLHQNGAQAGHARRVAVEAGEGATRERRRQLDERQVQLLLGRMREDCA